MPPNRGMHSSLCLPIEECILVFACHIPRFLCEVELATNSGVQTVRTNQASPSAALPFSVTCSYCNQKSTYHMSKSPQNGLRRTTCLNDEKLSLDSNTPYENSSFLAQLFLPPQLPPLRPCQKTVPSMHSIGLPSTSCITFAAWLPLDDGALSQAARPP